MTVRASDICLIIVRVVPIAIHLLEPSLTYPPQVAIIFPPAAAAFIAGCSCDLLINICLTM